MECTFLSIATQLIISFVVSLFAVLVALKIDIMRRPRLQILSMDHGHSDNTYKSGERAGERWKFFRLTVINKSFPKPFKWIPRQVAEYCTANIRIIKINEEKPFISMRGRWADTIEMPQIPQDQRIQKLVEPDPVWIRVDEEKRLDVIVKAEDYREAYAWNNEAYFYDWRPQQYRLEPGRYRVEVEIYTRNGGNTDGIASLLVSESIESTQLKIVES